MRDIAAAAEVSQSTVSRVLSGAPTRVPIAAETRERVIAASVRLGYRPNPLARGLRGASTNLIGAVVRDFSDPFFAGAIEALVVESMAHGYNVVLGHVHGRLDEAIPLTSVLETRHTDAIVLLGDLRVQPQLWPTCGTPACPSWGCGRAPARWSSRPPTPTTGPASAPGSATSTSLGHRRIAFVSAELPGDYRVREDAYVDFMRERLGGVPDGYVERCPNTMAGGDAALRRLLELPDPPTAVATSTDLVAVGVLHAAHSLGATVPDQLSVVGYDDILIASHTVPALTTLRMPIDEDRQPRRRPARSPWPATPSDLREPSLRVFEPALIVRDSTAPAAPRRRDRAGQRGIHTRMPSGRRLAQA